MRGDKAHTKALARLTKDASSGVRVAGALALATPTIIFFLFDKALRVRFPRGLLTNWYYG